MTAKKQLSNELFEITTGLLLGDGNLQKPRTCVRYRFRFAQEATRKDYVLYLFDKYREYIKHPERGVKVAQRTTATNSLRREIFYFQTGVNQVFDYHASLFQQKNNYQKFQF